MNKEARERVAQYLHKIYGSPNFSWDEISERGREVLRERAEVIAELMKS